MDAINYFKLDLRMMKGYLKIYAIMPVLFIVFSLMNSATFALNYLFFFVLVVSSTPFSLENAGNTKRLYFSMPTKLSSMVLGRYLFLFGSIAAVFSIDIIVGAFLSSTGKITQLEMLSLFITLIIGATITFIQYPVFYKYGYEKGRLSSMLIYMIPVLLVFALPAIIQELFKAEVPYAAIVGFAKSPVAVLFGLLYLFLAGYLSCSISANICKHKEI